MYLKKLTGKNFRKFNKLKFYFNPFLNIIFAENGKGKTTLLEAIYFLLTGEGFREKKEIELLKFKTKNFWLQAEFQGEEEKVVKILAEKENSTLKKTILVDKKPTKLSDLKNQLPWPILFTPEDLKIINEDPETRRKYLNKILSKLYLRYKTALLNYENALKKRNKLLSYEEIPACELEKELKFWDEYLEKHSKIITFYRKEFIDFCNKNPYLDNFKFKIEYQPNEFTQQKAKKFLEKEKKLGYTLSGPHRDDFQIFLEKDDTSYDLKTFGSRSEQRLAILWLKNNEAKFIQFYLKKKHKKTFRTIFLLDDIFSELDLKNRKKIYSIIKKSQCFITTSYPETLESFELAFHIITL